jgi:hypothetical protein
MEILMGLIIIAASCMTSLENGQLRNDNQTLKLENQKLLIERDYQKRQEDKGKRRQTIEEPTTAVYNLN